MLKNWFKNLIPAARGFADNRQAESLSGSVDVMSRKNNPLARAITMFLPLQLGVPTKTDYAAQAREGYTQNNVVYACVRAIAQAGAGIPWMLCEISPAGVKKEIPIHPLLDLLCRPNPLQGQFEFMETVLSHLYIAGNSYIQMVGPGPEPNRGATSEPRQPWTNLSSATGQPRELYAVRPDRMKILPDPINLIGGYEYRVGGQIMHLSARDILHLKLFNPLDDFYGLSPVQVTAMAIDKLNAGDRWNVSLLQNAAMPSGALVAQGSLTDEQFDRLSKEIRDKYSGAFNSRRPMLLENGLEWKDFSLAPKDMDFVEGNKLSALQIAQAFNVPPELIGLISATHANREEARKALYTEVVLPAMRHLRDELNNWLVPRFAGTPSPAGGSTLRLDFNADAVEALSDDLASLWRRATDCEFLTLNEKRALAGYGPIPGGDVIVPPSPARGRNQTAVPPAGAADLTNHPSEPH